MSHQVLTDQDVARLIDMHTAVEKMEDALREQADGMLLAPPRFHVDAGPGELVFTAGAARGREHVAGFRVYDTFPGDSPGRTQLTAVYDTRNGDLLGVVFGHLIGAMRTGALGGVAVKHMARPDARRVGVLGSGLQAWMQLAAVAAVLPVQRARIFSPNPEHRAGMAALAQRDLHVEATAVATAREAVDEADILICATTSHQPVFDPAWLRPGVHVTTLGPKQQAAHELDPAVAEASAVIATDSLAQVDAYPSPFFLAGTPARERMIDLNTIVVGRQLGRTSEADLTLYCSVGLAGTEVVLAAEALARAAAEA